MGGVKNYFGGNHLDKPLREVSIYPFFEILGSQSVCGKIFEKKKVERNLQCQLCAKRMKVKFGGEKRMEVKLPPYKNTIFFGHQNF